MSAGRGQARNDVAAWIQAHQDLIGNPPIKFDRVEEPARTLVVWYETQKYLIELCVWDQADCLDIVALNKDTNATDYVVAGPCDGTAGLTERLDSFLGWLQLNEPERGTNPN